MKTIDNSPLNISNVGVIVTEECAVGRFYDNRFYLLTKDNQNLAEIAMQAVELLNKRIGSGNQFNTYDLEVIEKLNLDNHKNLENSLNGDKTNIIIQLYTPSLQGKLFIVANINKDNIYTNLGLMIYEAERISKAYFAKAVMDYAFENPEEFCEFAYDAISNKTFLVQSLVGAEDVALPAGKLYSSLVRDNKKVNSGNSLSHKTKLKLFRNVEEKLKSKKNRNDEKLLEDISTIIEQIDNRTILHWLDKQSPQIQSKFFLQTNPANLAKYSIMDLEIKKYGHVDKSESTYGKYRLLMKKRNEYMCVKFQLRNSFIVYLIYLIDRKQNGENVDTLNLSKYKELFCALYKKVYIFGGETEFDNMMKRFNQTNEAKQKGFNIVFHRMKEDIGDACETMREDPAPFLLRDCNAHLTVLPQHIIIPDELMELVKC